MEYLNQLFRFIQNDDSSPVMYDNSSPVKFKTKGPCQFSIERFKKPTECIIL
jgi:hypothetical protein